MSGLDAQKNPQYPLVRIDHVTKRFDDVVAVDNLNLDIGEGEFVTFLGPSGCGKSTTLRLLGGFETPSQGRIHLGGKDITRTPPNHRDVNMVFQGLCAVSSYERRAQHCLRP